MTARGKLTEAQQEVLKRGLVAHRLGGLFAVDYQEFRVIEGLRKKRLVKRWKGRFSKKWRFQMFEVTPAGRAALNEVRK